MNEFDDFLSERLRWRAWKKRQRERVRARIERVRARVKRHLPWLRRKLCLSGSQEP